MIQWARFASKATKLGKKAKKGAKKVYKKNPIFNKSDVGFIKQYPGLAAGAYNLATGQRKVRVKKQTAKEINKMKKTYNI